METNLEIARIASGILTEVVDETEAEISGKGAQRVLANMLREIPDIELLAREKVAEYLSERGYKDGR